MFKKIVQNLVSRRSRPAMATRQSGFTLTELLIAIVVGSLVIGSLLYVVIELLQINRREEVLTQTQQDMRRAIDYITRDAGEAIYIYSTPNAVVGQLDNFPRVADGEVPVLAFWRLDPLDPGSASAQGFFTNNPVCSTAFAGNVARISECNTLKVRQGFYTLVVYAQQPNGANDFWRGPARIVRYELPKYTAGGLPGMNITPGYRDPTTATSSFENWTKAAGGTTPRNSNGVNNLVVLTDFVDAPDPALGAESCPAGYLKSPPDANNFYACVLTNTTGTNPADPGLVSGRNQTLIVFLRGNASTQGSGITAFSDAGRLPTLRSEVLIRGVLDKQPGL
jgi:prepilin-type N-terminal cleavage/methylation domain-containing protein